MVFSAPVVSDAAAERSLQRRREQRANRIKNEIRSLNLDYILSYDDFKRVIDEVVIHQPRFKFRRRPSIYRIVVCFPELYPWKQFECNLEINVAHMIKLYKIPLWDVLSQSLNYDVVENIIKHMVDYGKPVRTPIRSVLNWCDTDRFVDVYTEAYYDCWTPVMCVKPMLDIFTRKLVI